MCPCWCEKFKPVQPTASTDTTHLQIIWSLVCVSEHSLIPPYIHKVSLLDYNVKWVFLYLLSSVVPCLFPQNWLMRPEDIWILWAEMLLFNSLMVGYQFKQQEYFALCTSHLTIFFFKRATVTGKWYNYFLNQTFLRTKRAQQICGLPDKVAVEWTKLPTTAMTCQMAWRHFGGWLVLISHHASGLSGQRRMSLKQ